jgi:hypothetical protein
MSRLLSVDNSRIFGPGPRITIVRKGEARHYWPGPASYERLAKAAGKWVRQVFMGTQPSI